MPVHEAGTPLYPTGHLQSASEPEASAVGQRFRVGWEQADADERMTLLAAHRESGE